jgi:hypothetical protein
MGSLSLPMALSWFFLPICSEKRIVPKTEISATHFCNLPNEETILSGGVVPLLIKD